MLDIWDIELAKYGARIIAYRGDFIEKLREISRKIHRDLTEGRERLDLHYESDIPLEKNGTTDIPKKDFGIRESFSESSVPKNRKAHCRRKAVQKISRRSETIFIIFSKKTERTI